MDVQRAAIDPANHSLSAIRSLQGIHDSTHHAFVDDELDDDNHMRHSLNHNSFDDQNEDLWNDQSTDIDSDN